MRLKMQALVPDNYEWANILDRLMINLYNAVPTAIAKAGEECREKHISPETITRVEALLHEQRARQYDTKMMTSKALPDKLTREMYVFLKQRWPFRKMKPREREDQLTRCTLRYATLGQGGQQWALNRDAMARIGKQGITTEAFASPFNNYFPKYFSIFQADRPFGSLGSFFTADPELLQKGLYANPPFTEAALRAMTRRLCDAARRYPTAKFVIVTPTWQDAPWYAELSELFQPVLKKDTRYFRLGEEFTPRFVTTLWTRNVDASKILG